MVDIGHWLVLDVEHTDVRTRTRQQHTETGGMFSLEAEMKAPVRRWLSQQGMYVAEELTTGWGICDVVGCRFDPDRVAYRTERRQRQPLGSPEAVFIYSQLPDAETSKRGMTLKALARRLGPYIGVPNIERTLERLASTNHVQVTKTGSFQKVNGWAPLYTKLMSIELKLNRLSEVVEQARANRTFVPESFVALPADVADRAMASDFSDQLADEGLGLLSVSKSSCRVLLEPQPSPPRLGNPLEMWVVEQFWRSHRGKH